MNRNTLSLKKPAPKPAEEMRQHANKKTRAEQSFINMPVVVQGKSPSHWCGVVESFDGGWLIGDKSWARQTEAGNQNRADKIKPRIKPRIPLSAFLQDKVSG